MKLLYLDIETSPLEVRTWSAYEANALEIMEDFIILGAAYAWNDGKVKATYPNEFGPPSEESELAVLDKLWYLLDEANVVVAHNGDKFDLRKINARLVRAGFGPPSPYLTIDTLKSARRYFGFTSNRLDYLGKFLGLGGKLHHAGLGLWLACVEGDPSAWRKMKKYNRRDVELLRDVYKVLRPWIQNHPNMGNGGACSKCGSTDLMKRGVKTMKSGLQRQQLQCNVCGGYSSELVNGTIRP